MEFSWSALWNITDETPDNCEMFLNYSGMKLFLECLKVSMVTSACRGNCQGRVLEAALPVLHKQVKAHKFFYPQPGEQTNLAQFLSPQPAHSPMGRQQ